jgi:hypothetical protein
MAHLVRQQQTRYVDRQGKRVPKGTPGAKTVKEKSSKWYGCGIPGQGKKRVPLAADKEAAQRMLNELVKAAERGEARIPNREAGRLSLKDHISAFEHDLRLGIEGKGGKKRSAPSEKQVRLVVQRVRDFCNGCKFTVPADLNTTAPTKVAEYLRERLDKPVRGERGISAQTAAFILAAARRFARWISAKAAVRPDLFDTLPGFDPSNIVTPPTTIHGDKGLKKWLSPLHNLVSERVSRRDAWNGAGRFSQAKKRRT